MRQCEQYGVDARIDAAPLHRGLTIYAIDQYLLFPPASVTIYIVQP